MFEECTSENLLNLMFEDVEKSIDKREGSIVYDTLSPVSIAHASLYGALDAVMTESNAKTASREFLVLRAAERGLSPYEATNAVLQGEFDTEIPIGSRFNLNDLNYIVIEKISDYTYKVECETSGTVGNHQLGRLIPIVSINGLGSAELTKLLIPARDEEDTEDFRARYFENVKGKAAAGNRADYIQKAKEAGAGQVKVFRAPLGGGTVRVVITDTDGKPASKVLLNQIKEVLDPMEHEGEGYGLMPYGHIVTVASVTTNEISVKATIEYSSDTTVTDENVINVIKEYIREVNKAWENTATTRVYAAQIIARIIDIPGVINATNVKINDSDYVQASNEEIFTLREYNGEEV